MQACFAEIATVLLMAKRITETSFDTAVLAKGLSVLNARSVEELLLRIGTIIYGQHHSLKEILGCLAILAKRKSLADIHRIKGIKEETAMD